MRRERAPVDGHPRLLAQYTRTRDCADVEVFSVWAGMQTACNDILYTLGPHNVNYLFSASLGEDADRPTAS